MGNLAFNSNQLSSGISIIIACYNGSQRLPKTLYHIFASKIDPRLNIPVELIIVDNASTDGTINIAKEECISNIPTNWNFLILSEQKKGKDNAINLAFSKCNYKYAFIIDDDNWIDSDYLQKGYNIMVDNNQIGALGGLGTAVFEVNPPEWGKNGICCGPQGSHSGDITNHQGWVLGAGCVYNMDIINRLYSSGFKTCLGTFRGQSVDVSGEDVELCYAIRMLGYKIWYSENLRFGHFMPANRMVDSRFISINRGFGVQSFVLGLYESLLTNPRKKPTYMWFVKYYIRGFVSSVFCTLKSLMKSKNSIYSEVAFEKHFYRLKTFANFKYCISNFSKFTKNIASISNYMDC